MMMKSVLIIENEITTLSDRIKAWIDIIGQKRLEDYKISRDNMRISNKIDELTNVVYGINRSLRTIQCISKNTGDHDELKFLNSLLKDYDEVHYKVEDRVITVYLKRNMELKKFRELNKKLRDRGYAYDHRTYR